MILKYKEHEMICTVEEAYRFIELVERYKVKEVEVFPVKKDKKDVSEVRTRVSE